MVLIATFVIADETSFMQVNDAWRAKSELLIYFNFVKNISIFSEKIDYFIFFIV